MGEFKIISDSGVKIVALWKEKNSWNDLTNYYESGFYPRRLAPGRIIAGADAKIRCKCRLHPRNGLSFMKNSHDEWPCG